MTKREFLSALGKGLSGLPQNDIEERISFYSEMIDDRMEEGLAEEEAVAQVGSVDKIASDILAETPLSKLVRERAKSRRKRKAWEIVLIVFGAPVWIPLLLAAAIVVFALFTCLWALNVALWAVFTYLIAAAIAGIGAGVWQITSVSKEQGIAMLGYGLFCAGAAIFLFFGCKAATVGSARLTKKFILWLKKCFAR